MGLITVNGIVTRYANYRDNDRILTIFTRERGLLSASARGCRRPKSKLLAASEMFVYGEFVLFQNKDKFSLESCEIQESFYPLREDIARFSAAAYMLSFVNEGMQEEPNEAMLPLLLYALTYAAHTEQDPLDIAICFAVRCMRLLGYSPAITRCAACGHDLRGERKLRFSGAAGGALCPACAAGFRDGADVTPLALEAMRRMLLLRDEEMNKVRLPEAVRRELKYAVNDYAEHVFERHFKAFDCL